MDRIKQTSVSLAQTLIHTFIIEQEYNIIDEICMDNCIAHQSYGLCFDKKMVIAKAQPWGDTFKIHKLKNCEEVISDHSAYYQLSIEAKHIGTFKSIEPTGKNIIINTMAMVSLSDTKIERLFISSNIADIVNQLSDSRPINHLISAPTNHPNMFENVINKMHQTLQIENINLTKKQITHLCLWVMDTQNEQIASILNCSRRTVHAYQALFKMKFNCTNKEQLIESIKYLHLYHLLTEGFLMLMSDPRIKHKKMFN